MMLCLNLSAWRAAMGCANPISVRKQGGQETI
jgi:hypothetical protein